MKETQTNRLLRHLEAGYRVTPLDAWEKLGIYRLSARAHDLRRAGYPVFKNMVEVKNRFGEKVRVAAYKLEEELCLNV